MKNNCNVPSFGTFVTSITLMIEIYLTHQITVNICLEGCSLDAIPSVIMHDNDKINTEDTYAGTRDGLEWVC